MKIGSIKENLGLEQRIAVTPEIIKKYKSLDLNIILPKGYGEHLGISDKEFSNEGAEMLDDNDKVLLYHYHHHINVQWYQHQKEDLHIHKRPR